MTEASVSAPCCGNCRYSVINGQLGTCHRYAPRPDANGTWAAWPLIQPSDWCGEWESHAPDPAPPVSPENMRALADFMAQTGATPLFDGFDGPPAPPRPEAPPATAEPEFLTYDEPFEDPLL